MDLRPRPPLVQILQSGRIRVRHNEYTPLQFRKYLRDPRHARADVLHLARQWMEALWNAGISDAEAEINERCHYALRNDTLLRNGIFRPSQANPPPINPTPVSLRDRQLVPRITRQLHRYRDRHATPKKRKTHFNKDERLSIRNLRNHLRGIIPRRKTLKTLGKPAGDVGYFFPGEWLQRDASGSVAIFLKDEELREASVIDPSHANDWLAFEDADEAGVGCNRFKVLTRAQLLQQKAESLETLPAQCFTRWNRAVEGRHP